MTDTAIIGQIPENATIAQGGVGLAAGLVSLLVWSLAQVRTAVSSIVSQYLGKNQLEQIKSLIPFSLLLTILLGVIAWIGTSFWFEPICSTIFGEPESQETFVQAELYYQIRSMGLPFSLFIACSFGIFRGLQNTTWAMMIGLTGGGLNLVLDLLLVNGSFLSPALGVEGAGWASLISQGVMSLMCVYFIQVKTPYSIFDFSNKIAELRNMLLMFINMFIRTIAVSGTFILAYRYANLCGNNDLAAYTIGNNIWLFSSYFIDGFSNAGNAISGKLLGERDFNKLRLLRNDLLRINLFIGLGLALVYLLLYTFIGGVFNGDSEVIAIFNSFFWIVIVMQPFNSIAFSYDGMFKGLGEAKVLRNTLLLGTFGLFVPIIVLVHYFTGSVFSIWLAFAAWMVFRGMSLHLVFQRKYVSKAV